MSQTAVFLAGVGCGASLSLLAAAYLVRRRLQTYGRMLTFCLHEFSTPMTAINMTLVNLATGVFGEVPPEHLKWIEMSHDQLSRLSALVQEASDFVHLRMNRDMRPDICTASSAQILEDALSPHRRAFAQSGIVLTAQAQDDLPACRTDMQRAIRSLAAVIQHAKKFRARGAVKVSAARRDARVAFEVSYDGRSLSADEVEQSLDLLYPARLRDDHVLSASGLGLGFVRSVLERIGGSLQLSVGPQGATSITILLPQVEAP